MHARQQPLSPEAGGGQMAGRQAAGGRSYVLAAKRDLPGSARIRPDRDVRGFQEKTGGRSYVLVYG